VPRKPSDQRPDEAEQRLFEEEMEGVRPLDRRTGRSLVVEPEAAPARATPVRSTGTVPAAGQAANHVVERWGESYAVLAPGVDRRVLRELRAGDRAPEAELDLHGMTAAKALAALGSFLGKAQGEGRRTVLVIHGRGRGSGAEGPVLRDRVIDALAEGPLAGRVLAATSAPPALGGPGAGLVLLRRRA
jgi:DNA-nicking Smr family endonuclease